MKKFKLHFILLYMSFFVLMLAIPVNNCIQAQWIQTNGPYGGTISSIAADGNKVVADISFLSTDAGKNWKPINKIKSLNSVQALLIRGDTILAGINYGGLYISTNNGSNWDQNIQGLKADADIMSLAIAGNGKIYAGTDSGLFNSTNNGISWSPVHVGLIKIPVTSIAVKESLIALATRDGIFLSMDYGSSWKMVNSELHDQYSKGKVTFNGNTIVFAIDYRGVFVSVDNGSTWKESNQGLDYKTFIYCLKSDGHNIYLGSYDSGSGSGFFKSTDNGSSWHFVNDGFPSQTRVLDIAVSGTRIYTATEGAGVVVSPDSGSAWNQSNNGITGLNIRCLGSKGDSLFAGTTYGGIFLSTNNGINYQDIYKHYSGQIDVSAFAFDSKNIYAATSGEGVIFSTDNGISWKSISPPSISSLVLHKNYIFITRDAGPGHFGGLYYSTDKGNNWTKITILPDIQDAQSVTSNGTALFVIVLGKIYSSLDDGLNWILSEKGIEGKTVNLVRAKLSSVFAAADSGKLFRSSNNGGDWNLSNKGLPADKITSFAFWSDSIVFAGTDSSGVYLSLDYGGSWKPVNSNLPEKNIRDLLIKGDYIFAAANSTIWRRNLSEMFTPTYIELSNKTTRMPESFFIEQNYPNPFNPFTTISYSLPEKTFVELKLYDMLGREVSTLVNKEQSPGVYNILFNGSFFPSGIYIYRIKAGGLGDSKKLILLK